MTYADAMARFGSDKPDLRFGQRADRPDRLLRADRSSGSSRPRTWARWSCPAARSQTRKELDGWQEWAKSRGARGLGYVLIDAEGAVSDAGPVAKNLSEAERAGLPAAAGAGPGDAVFFAAGQPLTPPAACSAPPGWRSATAAA